MLCETQSNRPFAIYARSIQAKQQPGVIDLSCALPQNPPNDLARIVRRVSNDSNSIFFYDAIEGQSRLRHQIANLLLQLGLEASADEILIVNGAMQGLSLAMRHHLQLTGWLLGGAAFPIFGPLRATLLDGYSHGFSAPSGGE
ncbi:MAG: hypothetical protein Q6L68_01000 [Thermostichus sp. DG02_5_bins_236]